MDIKNCAHCGAETFLEEVKDDTLQQYPFRVFCGCGMTTCNFRVKEIAIDIWNSRVEQDSATIDRWFKEATEQRDRADKAEAERDELKNSLSQAIRMMEYAGKMQ